MTNISKQSVFIALLIAVSLLVLSLGSVFMVKSQTAYADYDSDYYNNQNAIVNFNQLWDVSTLRSNYSNIAFTNNNGLISISGTNNNSWDNTNLPISDTTISLVSSHKYYMCYNYVGTIPTIRYLGLISSDVIFDLSTDLKGIYTSPSNQSVKIRYGVIHQTSYNVQFYVYLIDLTQMYGQNSEPDFEECQRIFTADYYAYNSGSPVAYNTIDSYSQGYNDAIGNLDVVFEGSLLANNIFGVNCDVATAYDIGLDFSVGNANRQANDYSIFGFNFPSTLLANDVINIYIDGLAIWSDTSYKHLEIGYYENGVFNSFADLDLSSFNSATFLNTFNLYGSVSTSINLNRSINTLYFKVYGRSNNAFGIFQGVKITAHSNNLDFAISDAYQQGYDYAKNYYDNYYGSDGTGYNSIYNSGYQSGINAQLDEANRHFYTFPQFLGALFDVPVKTITSLLDFEVLGFNLKNFFFSLITLSIIFALIKFILVRTGDK